MKKDNKGFSLIELIIVIAIMAVLIVVLAPQFTKYIERGRKSTDVQNVASIVTALEVYAADPMVTDTNRLQDGAVVTLETTTKDVDASVASGNAHLALIDAGITEIGLTSGEWFTSGTTRVTLTVDITNGTVTVDEAGLKKASVTADGVTQDFSLLKGVYE